MTWEHMLSYREVVYKALYRAYDYDFVIGKK